MSGFAPPLPAPSSAFPILHTPRTDQQRVQCEGVNGRYQEHCQQIGQMMPGFAFTPGLPPGLPTALQTPPCISYCTLPSGDQSTYDERTGSWSPPLRALQGFGAADGGATSSFITLAGVFLGLYLLSKWM